MAETLKEKIVTYDGQIINFYPNSHQYKKEGERTTLLSPSAIVGIVDKSAPLLIWNDNLVKDYYLNIEDKDYNKDELIALSLEAINQRNIKTEEACDVGSYVHDYAEACAKAKIKGEELPDIDESLSEQYLQAINSYLEFEKKYDCHYIKTEEFIYSKSLGVEYVGKYDVMMGLNVPYEAENGKENVKRVVVLGDWKSSKGVYFTQKMQLAGYDIALEEEYSYKGLPLPYDEIALIHLDKNTGTPTLYILSQEERADAREAFKNALHLKNITKKHDKWNK